MKFTTDTPTTPGFYAWRSEHADPTSPCDVVVVERGNKGGLFAYFSESGYPLPVSEIDGQWCRLVPAEEAEKATDALQKIVRSEPCIGEGGGCFYPMHDGDGNYIGEQNVDPLTVIQEMTGIAREAIDAIETSRAKRAMEGKE